MDYLQQLTDRYPSLSEMRDNIYKTYELLVKTFQSGGKLLAAGNGGSAADCEHMVGELMKNFVKKRKLPDDYVSQLEKINAEIAEYLVPRLQPGLPAIALTGHNSLSSASINDIDGFITFAQQVYGYGKRGDLFLGISTSGNAKNVIYAAVAAKAKDMAVVTLTGGSGGILSKMADISIIVPETETYKIQELHLPVYHTLCLMVEEHFFP
jgi:D-sedoheptulose 7-phosphate isomerase